MKLRLLSYNIRFGGTGRAAPLAEVIRAVAPDVVMLQEATQPDVVRALAEATGLAEWGARVGHSTAFLSRLPVAHHEWHHPPRARHPFLEVVLAGGETRLFGLHLTHRFSKWDERRRAREIRALLDGIRDRQDGFHALAGDFNALAPGERLEVARMPGWIRALIWLSGRDIARETIQFLLDSGYADAFRTLHPDDVGHTFPTWDPHVRLDYVFTPTRYAGRVTRCEVVRTLAAAPRASDHFPLVADLETE